jgi:hypothetical protein
VEKKKKRNSPPPRKPRAKEVVKKRKKVVVVTRKERRKIKPIVVVPEEEKDKIDDILFNMKTSIDITKEILKKRGESVQIEFEDAPSTKEISIEKGKELFEKPELFAQKKNNQTLFSKCYELDSWWSLCRKSFEMNSIMDYLKKNNKIHLIEKTFDMTYRNARKYYNLSQFLTKYPKFIYQMHVTGLKQWTYLLQKDSLENHKSFEVEFWK